MIESVKKKMLKLLAFVVLFCSSALSATAAPIGPTATARPQPTAVPVLEFPSCKRGERSRDSSLLYDKLVGLKSQLSGAKLVQMEENIDSFLSASPSLNAGECAAIESESKPSFKTIDALFRDFLGRKAMYAWKYNSGVFPILKKSGARSNLSCRIEDKPVPNLPTLSGGTNPMWKYCCRVEPCFDELTVQQTE